MTPTPKLALGTAQFGLDYGVTNQCGQVNSGNVKALLSQAMHAGIHILDTAQAYGNAEQVLGDNFPTNHSFQIISKLPAQPDAPFDSARRQEWQNGLENSLKQLNTSHLDALLLHRASDLKGKDGARLLDWLHDVRDQGLTHRIGVSIYTDTELDHLPLKDLQIIQLPCSLYDQRLIENHTVDHLQQQGVALHARSLYLQGLLVTPSCRWPESIPAPLRQHHQKLEALASERQCSLVDLALGWARQQTWMEAAVVGVTQCSELDALIHSWEKEQPWQPNEDRAWAWSSSKDLDPRQWAH